MDAAFLDLTVPAGKTAARETADGDALLIADLRDIVGRAHVLTSPEATRRFRTGIRFGSGPVVAVVRPGSLVEQWRVLKACVAADKIVIMQSANTGVTGGSTPDGDDYDRGIVLINTMRIEGLHLINDGTQVVCLPGTTLFHLEKALAKIGRAPHSVIGSSCIGASVFGGVCNNSGGALIHRGPAFTQLALFARLDEAGSLHLVNHLGIALGNDPETILRRVESGDFTPADIVNDPARAASDHDYADHVRDIAAPTPSRFNADPRRLFEASGSAGKVMLMAVRLDTFPKEKEQVVFYIGSNDTGELEGIRRDILSTFKDLPIEGEYMHRDSFNCAEVYGKDTFLVIHYLGTDMIPRLFALQAAFDNFCRRIAFLPNNLSAKILQALSHLFPKHLPRRMTDYRDRFAHYLLLKMGDEGIDEARAYLKSIFPSKTGDYFECTPDEGDKAFLHRFAAAGAAIRYRAVHDSEVEDIVALDIALRRNDENWFETLPEEIDKHLIRKLYCGHFFCHVFHQDYIVAKGSNCEEIEHAIWKLLDARGAEYPAEHNVGHLYFAKPAMVDHFKALDPCNTFNPGIGRTTKCAHWMPRGQAGAPAPSGATADHLKYQVRRTPLGWLRQDHWSEHDDRTGGELIQDFLATYDIPFVFGNPGTTETTFLAAVAASKATYVLSLHESSAVGIAAGYALITGKPSIVSLHTYPGLANGMFNMRNALMSGVPLLVINGQQDSRFLIHNPVLGAPNVQLAQTATKYAYEVTRTDDLAVALQRCYLHARLQPTGPVFLSIPMNFMLEETGHTTFKKTRIVEDVVPHSIGEVADTLKALPAGKLAIVADYAVGAAHGIDAISRIASALGADIYAAPFHVQGTVDPLHPNFRGQLPPTTKAINETLGRYHTMLLIGEKVDSFTYDGLQALPPELQVIQIAPAASQLGFDFPCDMAVLGDIQATLDALATALGADTVPVARTVDEAALDAKYPASGPHASDALILAVLRHLDRSTHVITEGSSEDAIVQDMAVSLGFRNVHFSPRGGGLGWGLPLGVGIGLASGKHAACFVGDGGSLFSIHALWTAAKYSIPSIFICFVNNEYRLLKDLWCNVMGTTIATTHFVGLDFSDPDVDMRKIAEGFGARVETIDAAASVGDVLARALAHQGPSFLIINREP